MAEPDRCYICLGSGDETPPLARPSDSSELIQVCPCSLRAHRRCLTDWASDMEYRSRDDPPSEYTAFLGNGNTNEFSIGVPVGILSAGFRGKFHIMQTKVRCPQCATPLFVVIKPSRLLTLQNLIKSTSRELSKTAALAVFGSAAVFALSVSVVGIFVSTGSQMFLSIAPESVLTNLLDLKSRKIDIALRSEEVGVRQLFLLGSFPMFLFGLRSDNTYLDLFSSAYPTFFFNNIFQSFLKSGPKVYLFFTEPLKRLYWLTYSLTFNRLYYRWTRLVKPIFLADRLSLEELSAIEEENNDLKYFKAKKDEREPQNLFKRCYSYLFKSSEEEKALWRKRAWRETKAILLRDYGTVFDDRSFFTKALTTILWPFLGAKLGKLLLRVVKVNELCNRCASTPDEATYVANLLGSVLIVLIKDLFKLYIAWSKVKQLMNITVVQQTRDTERGNGSFTMHV